MAEISRRSLIKASGPVGAALLTGGLAPQEASAQAAGAQAKVPAVEPAARSQPAQPAPSPSYLFLNKEEAAFIEAAVARLIPADEQWGGAVEAGVPSFIDKQLDDYRSGRRAWGVMGAIAKALTPQDIVNVAAYYALVAPGAASLWSGPTPDEAAPRLVVLGDPKRGIAPCAACHGPAGYKQGAPPLAGQHAGYLERQLLAFAQSTRRNDVYATMRTISRALSAEERSEIARYYGAQAVPLTTKP